MRCWIWCRWWCVMLLIMIVPSLLNHSWTLPLRLSSFASLVICMCYCWHCTALIRSYVSLSLVSETPRYLNSSTWGTIMIQTWLDQRDIFQRNIMASDILPHVVFSLSHIWCGTACVVYQTVPFTTSFPAPSFIRSIFPLFPLSHSCPSCRVSSPCLPHHKIPLASIFVSLSYFPLFLHWILSLWSFSLFPHRSCQSSLPPLSPALPPSAPTALLHFPSYSSPTYFYSWSQSPPSSLLPPSRGVERCPVAERMIHDWLAREKETY